MPVGIAVVTVSSKTTFTLQVTITMSTYESAALWSATPLASDEKKPATGLSVRQRNAARFSRNQLPLTSLRKPLRCPSKNS